MRTNPFSAIAVLLAFWAPAGRAQDVQEPPPMARNGFQLLNLSGYAVYYSSSLPANAYQPGAGQLLSDAGGGGSARLGWMSFGERSSFSFIYTPSFTGRARYSEWNALNHTASLTAITHPAPRWTLGFAVNGDYSSTDQFLFAPTAYSAAVAAPGQFTDLAAALLAGRFSTPQLATLFTNAPTAQSPLRDLLYGQRMFTAGGQISLSYSSSPRLSFTFTGNGTRNQNVQNDRVVAAGNGYVLAETTLGSGSASFNYSLSPLTQLGGTVTVTRTVSPIYDAYTTTSLLTLGHTFAKRWLLQAHGGVGVSRPLFSKLVSLATSEHPIAGGSIGFRTFAHTCVASFDRVVNDAYGTGATKSSNAGGTWRWSRPGSSWWLEAGGGWEQLQGMALFSTSGWRANAGLGRLIGSHTTLLTQYAYLHYEGVAGGSAYKTGQSAVRVSVVWSPSPVVAQ